MNDDLSDIDPKIVETVLVHADEFIEVDNRVNEIVEWGKAQLDTREQEIKTGTGTLEEFKKAAAEIEAQVAQKLSDLEEETRTKYPAGE